MCSAVPMLRKIVSRPIWRGLDGCGQRFRPKTDLNNRPRRSGILEPLGQSGRSISSRALAFWRHLSKCRPARISLHLFLYVGWIGHGQDIKDTGIDCMLDKFGYFDK